MDAGGRDRPSPGPGHAKKARRVERLAAQLRTNLKRRKDHLRATAAKQALAEASSAAPSADVEAPADDRNEPDRGALK